MAPSQEIAAKQQTNEGASNGWNAFFFFFFFVRRESTQRAAPVEAPILSECIRLDQIACATANSIIIGVALCQGAQRTRPNGVSTVSRCYSETHVVVVILIDFDLFVGIRLSIVGGR